MTLENSVSELSDVSLDASNVISDIEEIRKMASNVDAGRGSIVGPDGDHVAKQLLEFANLPNRREIIEESVKGVSGGYSNGYIINKQLDKLVESVSKEQQALTRLGQSSRVEDKVGPSMNNLIEAKKYIDEVNEASYLLKDSMFDEFTDRFKHYEYIIGSAKSDFSFDSWATNDLAESLDVLEGSFIPSVKNRLDRDWET